MSKFTLFPKTNRNEIVGNYQPALEEALAIHGWSIKDRKSYTNHLWFIELWCLQSQWSPTDLQVFLMFEDDEIFCSAAITLEEPLEHHSTDWKARLYLKRGWEQKMVNFVAALNAIRDEVVSSSQE